MITVSGLNAKIWKLNVFNCFKNFTTSSSGEDAASAPSIDLAFTLNEIAGALDTAYRDLEPEFLELGQNLQAIYTDAVGLTKMAQGAASLISGNAENVSILQNIDRLAHSSLAELQRCQEVITEKLLDINTITDYLNDLDHMCTVIDRLAMFLRVVALYIGVESSRSSEADQMFSDFIQEIKQLVGNIKEVSENVVHDSRIAQNSQINAHRKISNGLGRLQELVKAARQGVHNAVAETERLLQLSLNVMEQISLCSKAISRNVGEIVVAIQFHDITRQKIEHVIEALQELRNEGESDGKNGQERINTAYAVMSLQSEQVSQVIKDVTNAHQEITQAFEMVQAEFEKLAACLDGLSEDRSENCSGRDPFELLQKALQELSGLLHDGHHLGEQLGEAAGSASDTAVQLSRHLHYINTINYEMRIKSINAIVKTAHLSDKGETLDILAQEVNKLSNQLADFVEKVVGVLDLITSSAQRLELAKNMRNANGDSSHSFESDVQNIYAMYQRFQRESSDTSQRAVQLQKTTSMIRAGLLFLPNLMKVLSENHIKLDELIHSLKDRVAGEGLLQEAVAHLKTERYTMESEREVYRKVFDQELVPAASIMTEAVIFGDDEEPEQGAGPEFAGEEDFGDNIELF